LNPSLPRSVAMPRNNSRVALRGAACSITRRVATNSAPQVLTFTSSMYPRQTPFRRVL
jgi:hypothetical protein